VGWPTSPEVTFYVGRASEMSPHSLRRACLCEAGQPTLSPLLYTFPTHLHINWEKSILTFSKYLNNLKRKHNFTFLNNLDCISTPPYIPSSRNTVIRLQPQRLREQFHHLSVCERVGENINCM